MPSHKSQTSDHKHKRKHKHSSEAPPISTPQAAVLQEDLSGSQSGTQSSDAAKKHRHHKHKSQAPQGPTQPPLSDAEKTKLAQVRTSLVGRKAREIQANNSGDWELLEEERSNPEVERTRKRDVADSLYSGGVMDMVTPGADAASGFVDYFTGGSDRGWNVMGKKVDSWGDGSLQSSGIPIVSAVAKSISNVIQAGKYIKQVVEYHRAKKDEIAASTGSSVDKDEKTDLIFQTLEIVQNLLDTAMSWIGAFTTLAGHIPLLGAILGAISSGMSFAVDTIQLVQSNRNIAKMREQKAAAKGKIQGEQGVFGRQVATGRVEERRTGVIHRKTVEKFKVSRTFEEVRDEGTNKKRAMRLDEKTKQLRAANGTLDESQEAAVRDLEDYDITKELTSANKKRRREGAVNLVFKDAAGFASALAGLDPTGLGSAIGASISAVVGLGYAGKAAVTSIRQAMRNHGVGGADLNKSDANKRQRRHNLAVIMYDRIMELANTRAASIENPDSADDAQRIAVHGGVLDQFDVMNDRVGAMGVSAAFLHAHSAPEMVSVMRQGFYRDSGD